MSMLVRGLMAAALVSAAVGSAEARVVRLENLKVEPAFGGKVFADKGAFERVTGRVIGEVDPKALSSAGIQDIGLAPRNARGMVEYDTDIDIIRPADPSKSNGVLFFNVLNRGNKGGMALFNVDVKGTLTNINAADDAADGWMQKQGYTVIWFGWQADVLPGNNRMLLRVPVAKNPDGSPVTGVVRAEFAAATASKSQDLGAGWFTAGTHASYPTASLDNTKPFADGFLPTLTVRSSEKAARVAIPNSAWSFADCKDGAPKPDPRKICLTAGFEAGKLYELIYRAQDPTVMGLGFAAMRDLADFLKTKDKDDKGTPNPVAHNKATKAIIMGSSQSGRMMRTFLHLGFNKAESGWVAYDGMLPHIGGGLLPLSVRFAQPGRAWGESIDHSYPAYDFPFTYARQTDPLTGRTQGLLDRCMADGSCPLIFHAATALEMWEGRQSLGLTDPLGMKDVADPANVRTFIMGSTQHSPAGLPLPAAAPFGNCTFQGNPNPYSWTMRALLDGLTGWVRDGKRPPAGAVPHIADGTLVAPDAVRFPAIPANGYGGTERPAMRFTAVNNPLHVLDRGPGYRAADTMGVQSIEPARIGSASYGVLVPQVDADGNDVGGVRSLFVQVPVGTYTGWNRFRDGLFDNGFCNLSGSFVPFAATKAEREAAGDPRPSLEERYPTKAAYVNAVRLAADNLMRARLLLQDDAFRLITEAETNGVRKNP